jgi:hypothetical protein
VAPEWKDCRIGTIFVVIEDGRVIARARGKNGRSIAQEFLAKSDDLDRIGVFRENGWPDSGARSLSLRASGRDSDMEAV